MQDQKTRAAENHTDSPPEERSTYFPEVRSVKQGSILSRAGSVEIYPAVEIQWVIMSLFKHASGSWSVRKGLLHVNVLVGKWGGFLLYFKMNIYVQYFVV